MDKALLLAAKDIEKGLLTIYTNEIIENYEDEHGESRNEIMYGLSIRPTNSLPRPSGDSNTLLLNEYLKLLYDDQ